MRGGLGISFGMLFTHLGAAGIRAFLEKHCVQYIELTQNQMIDIGGILPLMELDV